MRTKILVVDDDVVLAKSLAALLAGEGHRVAVAFSAEQALALFERAPFHLLLTDLQLPGKSGIALIQRVCELSPQTRAVLITGQGSIRSAVTALKSGAAEYLQKPVRPQRLLSIVRRLLAEAQEPAPAQTAAGVILGGLQTRSPAMRPLCEAVRAAAATQANVLLIGEPGAGKERTARAIFALSPESSGSFTRVAADRLRRSEVGALFVEGLADLDDAAQAALLRWLRSSIGEGPATQRPRLMFSSTRELAPLVEAGLFRRELLERIGEITLRVPALRERPEDIPLLTLALLRELSERHDRPLPLVPPCTQRLLSTYSWPGNARELRSVLEQALGALRGSTLEPELLPPELRGQQAPSASIQIAIGTSLAAIEREVILRTLAAYGGNKTAAAEVLGVSRRSIYNKLALYGDYEVAPDRANEPAPAGVSVRRGLRASANYSAPDGTNHEPPDSVSKE